MNKLTTIDVEGHMKEAVDPSVYKNIPSEARIAAVKGIVDTLNNQHRQTERGGR